MPSPYKVNVCTCDKCVVGVSSFSWEDFMSYRHTQSAFHSALGIIVVPSTDIIPCAHTSFHQSWLQVTFGYFQYAKPSLSLKEKVAISLTGYMFSHSSSGSQNIFAAEPFLCPLESFREVQFVRQMKAELLCLKPAWEA